MEDWPLNALRAFAVIHSTGGIRAAARELGVAHSAISRHLHELEAWVGAPLARSTGGRGGLVFTPAGDTLARALHDGFQGIGRVLGTLREARSERSVVVTTTSSFATRWLLARLPRFENAHRGIEVSVVVEQSLSQPGQGDADLAIRMGRGPWPDLHCEPLMDDRLYPVMSPAAWAAFGRPGRPSALSRLRLLHDRDPQASWASWKQEYGPSTLDVRSGPRFASSDLVLRAAALGQGVALARHRLVAEDVEAGILIRPMQERQVNIGMAYWIVMSDDVSPWRTAVDVFIGWLKKEAGAG